MRKFSLSALVATGLLVGGLSVGSASAADQLEQFRQECTDISTAVQSLSHELHPSILDHCGLVVAVTNFCGKFSKEMGMTVVFTHNDIPASLAPEIALSLFRVVQEALHNSAKYSGEKRFEVHLQGKPGEIELEVTDRGVGFDEASVRAEALGLVSMRERIRLLKCTITISFRANAGTRIRASIPLPPTAG